ncbi:glycosyltransferase [Aquabacterium sp. J223]|uniref:glycosyltransferase n=1 Tax=Aquabacterium sp. J223 TaxID=2898431 RepID=UPI0021AD6760|nr:glycosyltransferase [Aquabacterium sp. J223]UUX96102.1 glycosyltransferase [Aquabacterium sp. J223]
MSLDPGLGVVAIGRNEGERLRRCLQSVLPQVARVVYVDSGSTDGSAAMARGLGAEVVDLDLSQPFTAARARNAGLARLLALQPGLERVQFVDGDCEVVDGWLAAATAFLAQRPEVGVVCGRRRERHPERSVYNRLCDAEWNTPVGEARACGGDAMMRVAALQAVGGYREDLIAGEEPELCVRLRAAGWRVWRLDHEMTLHDAAMTRFGQWWRRTQRGGHAFAEGSALHGAPPERHWVRETRSGLAWGLWLPLAILLLALAVSPWALVLFAVYPLQVLRLSRRGQGLAHALFLVLGKFPEALGQLNYWWRRLTHGQRRLIEYK